MARDFNGSTDRIDYSSPRDAREAHTVACWFKMDAAPSVAGYLLTVHSSGDAGLRVIFNIGSGVDALTDNVVWQVAGWTSNIYRTSDHRMSTGVWTHLCATYDGGTESTGIGLFINGAEDAYRTTGPSGSGPAAADGSWSLMGRIYDDNRNLDGQMANFGYWNRVLSLAEIQMLADGFAPRCIPRGLKFAPDLVREIRDPVSGRTGTADGTSVVAHPRTVWPVSGRMVARVTAAAGSPWYYYAQLM